jgi:gamma-glutamyltranspeptidase/glutathione hydrolase
MDRTQSEWIIGKREAVAENGMVTAMHPLATAAGLEILQAGGNAIDAAVATAFAVGVVEPAMSGLGGVAAMVIGFPDGRTTVVDGSSMAPLAAREDSFELAPPNTVAGIYGWRGTVGDIQNTGYQAPIVPGQPACLLYALDRYGSGRLSRAQVMAPAIRLAEEGYPVDTYQAQTIAFAQRRLRLCPETFRMFFLEDGTPPAPATRTHPADRLVHPELASTLRLLAEHGPEVLYRGEIGERIVRDLQANGGLLTMADFERYTVREHVPGLRTDYRGYQLVGLSPTSGSMTAFEALNILDQYDLSAYGAGSPEAEHLIAEACRLAFLDRFAYLADLETRPVPVDGLLSSGYAARQAERILLDRADPEASAGNPWAFQRPPASARRDPVGAPGGDGCTTHLNVIDRDRAVVSLTSTHGEGFGSGVVPRGTGILLNNGMTWFDPEPGHVNSIAPGKRTLWAPTPTVVLQNDRPFIALGAPGGRRIISAVVQSLVNLLDFGLGVQAAVTAPRLHCEGPITEAEQQLGTATLDALAARGHRLEIYDETGSSWRFARPGGIRSDPETGQLTGGVFQLSPAWAMGH